MWSNTEKDLTDLATAFAIGLRFDTAIAGYIVAIPAIILSFSELIISQKFYRWVFKGILFYCLILTLIVFITYAADISYFKYYFSRLLFSILVEFEVSIGNLKLLSTQQLFPFVLSCLFFIAFCFGLVSRIKAETLSYYSSLKKRILNILLILGFLLIGMRGGVGKYPISHNDAYFCKDIFICQLGLNPAFTFFKSGLLSLKGTKGFQMMSNSEAFAQVQNDLNITIPDSLSEYPLYRKVNYPSEPTEKTNIVVVIMESMNAGKMRRYGNSKNLSPFLDSLAESSYSFDRIYTSGEHTYCGIYSTLMGYPTFFDTNPFKEVEIDYYSSLVESLKNNNYYNIFFNTYYNNFNNKNSFLYINNFDKVIGYAEYPSDKVNYTWKWGVYDDYMFKYAISELNTLNQEKKPFFAVVLTTADHMPYTIPEYFQPKQKLVEDQIVEYADWSRQKFFYLAKAQEWFENTLFIFVADHGGVRKPIYSIPIQYHHTPLVMYHSRLASERKAFDMMGTQMDILPTALSLLKIPHVNNTLGVDLFTQKRPYAYFTSDSRYGAINEEWFLIGQLNDSESLYRYKIRNPKDYSDEYPDVVKDMSQYVKTHLQVSDYLIRNKKTNLGKMSR